MFNVPHLTPGGILPSGFYVLITLGMLSVLLKPDIPGSFCLFLDQQGIQVISLSSPFRQDHFKNNSLSDLLILDVAVCWLSKKKICI
jgi:hypothetical protein